MGKFEDLKNQQFRADYEKRKEEINNKEFEEKVLKLKIGESFIENNIEIKRKSENSFNYFQDGNILYEFNDKFEIMTFYDTAVSIGRCLINESNYYSKYKQRFENKHYDKCYQDYYLDENCPACNGYLYKYVKSLNSFHCKQCGFYLTVNEFEIISDKFNYDSQESEELREIINLRIKRIKQEKSIKKEIEILELSKEDIL